MDHSNIENIDAYIANLVQLPLKELKAQFPEITNFSRPVVKHGGRAREKNALLLKQYLIASQNEASQNEANTDPHLNTIEEKKLNRKNAKALKASTDPHLNTIEEKKLNRENAKALKASQKREQATKIQTLLTQNKVSVELNIISLDVISMANKNALIIFNNEDNSASSEADAEEQVWPCLTLAPCFTQLGHDVQSRFQQKLVKSLLEMKTLNVSIQVNVCFEAILYDPDNAWDALKQELLAIQKDEELFWNQLISHEPQLPRPITNDMWAHPWLGAQHNAEARYIFSQFPTYLKEASVLNKFCGPWTQKAFALAAAYHVIHDTGHGKLSFSKTGSLTKPFFFQKKRMNEPFATQYEGHDQTPDPGRIGVQGTNFTTYKKVFRDPWITALFSALQQKIGFKAFIVDLKGCHSCFQAMLLSSKTSLIYNTFKTKGDIWETITNTSNGALNMTQKPFMKTVFYAALNGGSVRTHANIMKHLNVSRRATPNSAEYKQMNDFATAFLQHPVYKELLEVGAFWKTLKGEMYVPTRNNKIERKMTGDAYLKALDAYNKSPLNRPQPNEGDPMPHRLPTLMYTSLEVCFIIKVVILVYSYFKKQNQHVSIVQGIHDGVLFGTFAPFCSETLELQINQQLNHYSSQILGGISLSVSVTPCEDPNWINRLTNTELVDTPDSG